jgi:hypothetical protein
VQKALYLDACWIGETMNTEEWPYKTKKKFVIFMGLIVLSFIILGLLS